jgi:hypothetical protein
MEIELKHIDLAVGTEELTTDEVHTIVIDDRCFEVAAPKAQLDGRRDGMVRLEAGGQTFEKPLTDGLEADDMLSFRFYDLPWGETATVVVIFDETEDTQQYTLTLLKDATISGKVQQSETPHAGTIEAPKTSSPVPNEGPVGGATDDEPGEEDLKKYYVLVEKIVGEIEKIESRQNQEGEISEYDEGVQRVFDLLGDLRENIIVEQSFEQAKEEASRRLNHEGVKQALRTAIENFQKDQQLNPIDDKIFNKSFDLAAKGIQSTQTYDVKFRVLEREFREFYSKGGGGHAAGEVDQVTGKLYMGDTAWQHIEWNREAKFKQKSGQALAFEAMAGTMIHEAAGHILPGWCSHYAGGHVYDPHHYHEVLSATIGELTGEDSQMRTDRYSRTITAEDLEAWDNKQ